MSEYQEKYLFPSQAEYCAQLYHHPKAFEKVANLDVTYLDLWLDSCVGYFHFPVSTIRMHMFVHYGLPIPESYGWSQKTLRKLERERAAFLKAQPSAQDSEDSSK